MQDFQDTFQTPKRSFISTFPIYMTVLLIFDNLKAGVPWKFAVFISNRFIRN